MTYACSLVITPVAGYVYLRSPWSYSGLRVSTLESSAVGNASFVKTQKRPSASARTYQRYRLHHHNKYYFSLRFAWAPQNRQHEAVANIRVAPADSPLDLVGEVGLPGLLLLLLLLLQLLLPGLWLLLLKSATISLPLCGYCSWCPVRCWLYFSCRFLLPTGEL